MRRPALSISLYLRGTVLLVADGDALNNRLSRLENAGANTIQVSPEQFTDEMCEGKTLVMVHATDDIQHRVVAASRSYGSMTYAHDMPELSDFAMPALWSEGPLKIAISTDAMAPAFSRRVREQLGTLLESSRARISELVQELYTVRNSSVKGDPIRANLYKMASRFSIKGNVDFQLKDK